MLFSVIPMEAMAAEPEMTITVGSVEVEASATNVQIPVYINNAAPVTVLGVEFTIPEGLTLKGMTAGASIPSSVNETLEKDAHTAMFDGKENFTLENGVLLTLVVDVSSSASGTLNIGVQFLDGDSGNISNYDEEDVPVTFVSGTITVKASTTDRTVTFRNGEETVKTETVANGEKLTAIPAAPAAAGGQSFLGWYAVDGTDYLLGSVDETITGTEASTATAIYADTTYQAIWASSAMIAAGYLTADGKTAISGVSQAADLQTLVTNHNGGTVKLLRDVELPDNTYLTVAEGSALTLDLNGKTLSGNGYAPSGWGARYGVIYNQGALSLCSNATEKGVISLTDNARKVSQQSGNGVIQNKGTMPLMKNIRVMFNTTDEDAKLYAYYGNDDFEEHKVAVVGEIIDCAFEASNSAVFSSLGGSIGTIKNSTFTGKTAAISLSDTPVTAIENCDLTATDGTALELRSGTTVDALSGGTIKGTNGIAVEGYYGGAAVAFGALAPESVEGTAGYALVVGETATNNNQMTVKLTGGKYKGTEGALRLYSGATVTYPDGQKLIAGEDGWYSLQNGFSVTFLNANGTLLWQTSCKEGEDVTYGGAIPTKDADQDYVYTFANKWNTVVDGSGEAYIGNTIADVTSDLTLYAQYDKASAKVVTVTVGSGSTGLAGNYASLKAAMDALNSSGGTYYNVVITLNEDAVETSKVEVKKNVTIDLNGHKLTINNDDNGIEVAILKGATLTIKDSKGTGVYEHNSTAVDKYAIWTTSYSGTVVVESGEIVETGEGCSAIVAGNASKVQINGGTISGQQDGLVISGGSFAVSGGTIQGGVNGIYAASVGTSSERSSISGGKIIAGGTEGYALKVDYANPVTYIDFSGGRFKNTAAPDNLYPATDKNGAEVVLTFLDGKSLSPAPDSEGFYAVRVVGSYTLRLTADKNHYNAGETVTVTVSAYGTTAGSINSFGFTPQYATDKLTLGEVSSLVVGGTLQSNRVSGKSGYVVEGSGLTIGTEPTQLVQITFKAKDDINAAAAITLINLEMTKSGSDTGDSVTVEKDLTVNLHDIRVTLTAEHGSINGETSLTLYAKYGAAGLYSDAARTTPATVSVSAADGYRLNSKTGENLWLCGETGYADFNAIAALTYTGDKTFELQTTKVWTITFNMENVTGGSLSPAESITVDDGTVLSKVALPTITANEGYEFIGWHINNGEPIYDTEKLAEFVLNSDITMVPIFQAKKYAYTVSVDQSAATVKATSGVAAGRVTHGESVTFTVAPKDQNLITGVSYTAGNGPSVPLTPVNGVYTIPGEDILGDITVTVTTRAYYEVTFKAGTGNTLMETTLYIKNGDHTFYTNANFETVGEVPEVTADTGYRLNEKLWSDGTDAYTTEELAKVDFTADTTLTAQSVKQWTVTFQAGENGSLATGATSSLTLDEGTVLADITMPSVTPDPGYALDRWSSDAGEATTLKKDVTFTANFKDASYTASLDGGAAATVTVTEGITNGEATHGTDIKFTLKVNDGHKVTKVSYQIDGGEAQEIPPDENGVYTIPGSAITGKVTLVLTTNQTYTITFVAGGNGSVGGTTSFTLDYDAKLTTAQLDSVTKTGNAGYTFKEWQIDGQTKTDADITGAAFNASITITAIFDHATYTVTADGISGVPTEATHGEDLVFTPSVAGKVVTGITAKINGNAVAVTKNSNGTYTIKGSDITGALTITATTVDGGWEFIRKGDNQEDGYAILTTSEQIAIFTADRLTSGTYRLDGGEMFYSSKYNGYVKIVAAAETAETLSAKLSTGEGTTTDISYSGDINNDGKATPADGGMINEALHEVEVNYTLTEKQRLEMDVNGDKKVTTADIVIILQTYVGISNQ